MSTFLIEEEVYLAHYGILRKSGRYPWGSGATQSIRNGMFLDSVETLKKAGLSDVEIVRALDLPSTTALRALKSIAKSEQKAANISQAQRLKAKGMSNGEIAKKMGLKGESSVRALLEPSAKAKSDVLEATSNMLKNQVEKKKYLDIGLGQELHIGVSTTQFNIAVARLVEEGYEVHEIYIPQVGTGKGQFTNTKVLAAKGVTKKEVNVNRAQIRQITEYSENHGRSYGEPLPPLSINPKRLSVRYAEEGGAAADGIMYVRPNVADLSLGGSSYAQVRILVGKGHYLKGMAIYKDDLPAGIDIEFNTNKNKKENKLAALKEVSADPDNPFGAQIKRQVYKTNKKGERILTSAVNIVNEEGDWSEWSRNLSTQVLSKQKPTLAKEQLAMTYEKRLAEFERINSLTNPTVRKKLLETFAEETDSSAVHLKAAALPRQSTHVLIPLSNIPPSQIYAPNFRNGERVVLIRHPHAGPFEIPELVVNNNHYEGKKILGSAKDAIGIHHTVAQVLSGADFDGDAVLVIPNDSAKINKKSPLLGLKNFDPQTAYPEYEGMRRMTKKSKAKQMGDISNLITDMSIMGAPDTEIARAVRHSMVVIDAEKHGLNYKQSAIDNGIASLKKKYQGNARGGAKTLVSRAKKEEPINERKLRRSSAGGPIDKATGELVYVPTNRSYVDQKGKVIFNKSRVQQLALTKDAFTLSSGTEIERVYAEHSNKLKALANTARKEAVNTPRAEYSPSARKVYEPEVQRLKAALNTAKKNKPLERQAQLVANEIIKNKLADSPELDDDEVKKVKAIALNTARARTGAKKEQIKIGPREWEAIQAGAISDSMLSDILVNADLDIVRDYATPKTEVKMTTVKTNRAKSMLASGYTRAEIADALGVSVSTLDKATV